ncbi:hypothetical protein AB0M20_30030 [Actinoplanes sp. NPDC051633]|uniref:hypothetical protein n=1 Tax=Actinoplanes sp. NPDC051633 TaxID=3155670 RepID=UPI00341A9FF6
MGLAVVFTAALSLGRAVGPDPASAATHAEHSDDTGPTATEQRLPASLQVSEDGYRLLPPTGELSTGDPQPFQFRVAGLDGTPVTAYTTSHDKDLHLIVVRRDLSGFQHLHPSLAADGTWSTPFAVAASRQYRVFADFQPAGHEGLTLGVDIPALGDNRPRPLPPAGTTTTFDGYTVTRWRHAAAWRPVAADAVGEQGR